MEIPFGTAVGDEGGLLVEESFVLSFLIDEFALGLNGHRFAPGLVGHCFVLPYTWYYSFHSTVVPCRIPNAPANGQLRGVSGVRNGRQTATYSCDTGYNLVGNSTRTCQAGGVWSGSEPTCQGVLLLSSPECTKGLHPMQITGETSLVDFILLPWVALKHELSPTLHQELQELLCYNCFCIALTIFPCIITTVSSDCLQPGKANREILNN